MGFWIVRRNTQDNEVAEFRGFVVRAETSGEARILAADYAMTNGDHAGEEARDYFLSERVTVEELPIEGVAGVVFDDYENY